MGHGEGSRRAAEENCELPGLPPNHHPKHTRPKNPFPFLPAFVGNSHRDLDGDTLGEGHLREA